MIVSTNSCFNQVSTLTVQNLVDYARLFPWCTPTLGVAGASTGVALQFANDVMQEILSKSNPWKWNMAAVPAFETQPYQQDYPSNIPQSQLGWLQSFVFVDINNTSQPIPIFPGTAVQALLPSMTCGIPGKMSWLPNYMAQLGSWPGPSTPFVNPLNSQGGGPGTNPVTAILDPNGNIEVLNAYGVTTSNANGPSWPAAASCPGTITQDGTMQWITVDPNAVAFRLSAMATFNSQVFQIRATYQVKPPLITTLGQTFDPIPDDLQYLIKQGFLAMCLKQAKSPENKRFPEEFAQWKAQIANALGSADRELNEFGFYPSEPIQGGGIGVSGTGGYGYPGWPGWSSSGS